MRSLARFVLFVVAMVLASWVCACGESDVRIAPHDAAVDTVVVTFDAGTAPQTEPFDVESATATTSRSVNVVFTEPPDPVSAGIAGNYSIPGLEVGDVIVAGRVVTLITGPQSTQAYTVTVEKVARSNDRASLRVRAATFDGRATFNVTGAESTNSVTVAVTFDAPPAAGFATTPTTYSIPGLTISAAKLLGNTVTLTTSTQSAQAYALTVADAIRASDGERLSTKTAMFAGTETFNVVSALSLANTRMSVTFDAPPDAALATDPANYAVDPPLALSSGTIDGTTVTFTTSTQSQVTYDVTVSGVTRAADGAALVDTVATFGGRTTFNVQGATSTRTDRLTVTFDAPPDPTQATNVENYQVSGLTLGNAELTGSTVTLTTTKQAQQSYQVDVSGVTRGADGESLANGSASFQGRAPFALTAATSTSSVTLTLTFDAAPNASQAQTVANYGANNGLTFTGTPVVDGTEVHLTTSPQAGANYTVTVSNVTRASDGEPLDQDQAQFAGTAVQAPTVTGVTVVSTSPDNGTIPFNTGSVTVELTGTDFTTAGSPCSSNVKLDDLDGAGALVSTTPTSCSVNSNTKITATFPRGIRTNGGVGWNVLVTNSVGTNPTSGIKLVPKAGLTISEIYVGTSGDADSEFVEIYNPTATALDVSSAANGGIGLRLRMRNGTETSDVAKTLTLVQGSTIASHGFMLFVSTAAASETWYSKADFTYSAGLVSNGGVYLSLSGTESARVLDQVGWGTQSAAGREGTALADITASSSAERKPAGGMGHATDTDSNADDFLAESTSLTPRGTSDAAQP